MFTKKLRTMYVIFLSITTTVAFSSRVLTRYFFGKVTRQWINQLIQSWSSLLLKFPAIHYEVFNPLRVEPKPGQATIVMCNHTSIYDIPLSFKAFPKASLRMLAKKELSRIPFMGAGMKAAEFPFIDRRNRRQAIKDLAFMRALMESGIVIWIAPEGTRSQNGQLGSFKKGGFITAIEAKATIIPIGIRGAFDILPPHSRNLNYSQKAEIHIGQPIDASAYDFESRDELIKRVHAEMARLIG